MSDFLHRLAIKVASLTSRAPCCGSPIMADPATKIATCCGSHYRHVLGRLERVESN